MQTSLDLSSPKSFIDYRFVQFDHQSHLKIYISLNLSSPHFPLFVLLSINTTRGGCFFRWAKGRQPLFASPFCQTNQPNTRWNIVATIILLLWFLPWTHTQVCVFLLLLIQARESQQPLTSFSSSFFERVEHQRYFSGLPLPSSLLLSQFLFFLSRSIKDPKTSFRFIPFFFFTIGQRPETLSLRCPYRRRQLPVGSPTLRDLITTIDPPLFVVFIPSVCLLRSAKDQKSFPLRLCYMDQVSPSSRSPATAVASPIFLRSVLSLIQMKTKKRAPFPPLFVIVW